MALRSYRSKEWKNLLYCLVLCILGLFVVGEVRAEFPETEFKPLEFRLDNRAALLEIEAGVRRVRIQVDEGSETGWQTYSITHLDGRSGNLKLRLPDSIQAFG